MGFSLDDESLIHFILASIGSFPEDVPQIWPAYIGFSFSTLISKNYGLCCIPSQGFGESRTLDSCLDRGSSGTRAQCARRRRWSTHRTHREFVGSGSATVGVIDEIFFLSSWDHGRRVVFARARGLGTPARPYNPCCKTREGMQA